MQRTLSQNEAKVILDLEWRGQKTVTLAELRELLDASDDYARYMAHRLVAKGWLERLRPGLFQLVPADRGVEGVGDTHPLTAGAALVNPYFFSFGTACTYHGLTEQVFAEFYVTCRDRRASIVVCGRRYVFAWVPESRFFGFEPFKVLGHSVQMATLERALLDAVDRPRYAGGVGDVSVIAARAAMKVSWESLCDLTRRFRSSALVQRMGYLLDLHEADIPEGVRADLLELVRPNSKILFGSRRKWGTKGKLVNPWNVIENVPRDILASTDRHRQRPVVLRPSENSR